MKRFYIWYAVFSLVICTICGVLAVQKFEKEADFSKDLRIELPSHFVVARDDIDFSDSGRNYQEGDWAARTMTWIHVKLNDPLSEQSIRILEGEKRGWYDNGQGCYLLYRNMGNDEKMGCSLIPEDNEFYVEYEHGHKYAGFPLCSVILFAMFAITLFLIWLIRSVALKIRNK